MEENPRIEVPQELFAPAESSSFSGTYDLPVLEAGPDTYSFKTPLEWNATLSNTGGALLITGSVTGEAEIACARCLNDYTLPVEGEIEGYILLSSDESAPEDMDDDEFDVLGEDNAIDLAPLLNAALLIELPLIPLCSPDCKGLCTQCGHNLNEGDCSCEKHSRLASGDTHPNPFAVLKDFPFDEN